MESNKQHIDRKAALMTVIFMTLFVALLFFFGFTAKTVEEESGMLINFGDTEAAAGQIEPAKATPPKKTVTPPPPPVEKQSSSAKEEMNTQDFEEAAAIESAKKKAREEQLKKERDAALERQKAIEKQKEIERQKQLEIERQRIEEEQRLEAERKAQEAKADAIRQQTLNAFGKTNNNSTSQGTSTSGTGNQGKENGSVNSNGSGLGSSGNWSLAGRSLKGSLPKPNYKHQKEGIVTVEITVDRNGRVTSATPILRGSTTQDAQLWKIAKEAALKARFNANPTAAIKQVGTITYNFVLN